MANVYFSARSDRKVRRKLLVLTILFAGIMAGDIASGGAIRKVVRDAAAYATRGALSLANASETSGYFASKQSLARTVDLLEDQLQQYKEKAALYQVLKSENEELRQIVHLAAQREGITAPVISSMKSSPYGTFLIGAGGNDGVSVGDIVFTPQGFVIGRVSEAGARSSLVTELFSAGQSVEATIAGSATIVEGKGGGNGYAKMPHGIEVNVGDPVSTQTLGGTPIGIVGHVETSEANAYSDVYIGLPINLSSVQYVYVGR